MDNHASQFADRGISATQVSNAILQTVTRGTIIGQINGGTVYSIDIAGKVQNILVVISENGYIVNAYPWSK